jgi:hypothetical protein
MTLPSRSKIGRKVARKTDIQSSGKVKAKRTGIRQGHWKTPRNITSTGAVSQRREGFRRKIQRRRTSLGASEDIEDELDLLPKSGESRKKLLKAVREFSRLCGGATLMSALVRALPPNASFGKDCNCQSQSAGNAYRLLGLLVSTIGNAAGSDMRVICL